MNRFSFIFLILWIRAGLGGAIGAGLHEPESGVYLGVLLENGGTGDALAAFNRDAGRQHAIYGKFVVFKRDPFPSDWIVAVASNAPGAALHIILEPSMDFADFFQNWNPGADTYEAAVSFVTNCAAVPRPIFLRFAHEQNGWWYPWSPSYSATDAISNDTYITAWRNMADLVHARATNVAMVWAPNQGNGGNELPYYGHTYPGDAYVDWVGLSVYNGDWYGNSNAVMNFEFQNALQSGYWQGDANSSNDTAENFYWVYSDTNNPAGHHKPMMIAETSAQFVPQYALAGEVLLAQFENLSGAGDTDPTWWPPWGLTNWSLTTMAAVGGHALVMQGRDTNADWYIGGSGFSVLGTNQDWSGSQALTFYACRGTNLSVVDPTFKITCDSDDTENNQTEATLETDISNTTYTRLVIPFEDFTAGSGFTWSAVHSVRFELFTSVGGSDPDALYVDDLRRVRITLTNEADNLRWKQDWMHQVFAISNSPVGADPSYSNIVAVFPNLHAVNWFHVRKFEDGLTKDLKLPAFSGTPAFTSYVACIVADYFLTSVVTTVSAQPLAADFDGDRLADIVSYDASTGRWRFWLSTAAYIDSGTYTLDPARGGKAVAGDFDGDRLADPAVYAAGNWTIWLSTMGYAACGPYPFGIEGAIPLAADFDGDRLADPAVYVGTSLYAWLSTLNYVQVGPCDCGMAGAIHVAADFDGDWLADPAAYINGNWYAWFSTGGYALGGPYPYGIAGAIPVAADFDGDGLADLAVSANYLWYAWLSSAGYAQIGPYPFNLINNWKAEQDGSMLVWPSVIPLFSNR